MSKIALCDFCEEKMSGNAIDEIVSGEGRTLFKIDSKVVTIKFIAIDHNHDRVNTDICKSCLEKGGIKIEET